MKYVKLFDDFKINNIEGSLIKKDDIINCIKNNGVIYSDIIKNYKNNDTENPIKPISIDDDGLITVTIDGCEYLVDLKNVKKIEI